MQKIKVKGHTHTHTHPFNGALSGTTRINQYRKGKPIWILLKQETVSSSGITGPYASLHLAADNHAWCQHPTTQFFTSQMPFLPPNQQRQSTESQSKVSWLKKINIQTDGLLYISC